MKHANLRVWSVWRVWRQDEACQFKGLERLEGLKAGKRQAWIGEGLPSQQRFKGFKLFRGLEGLDPPKRSKPLNWHASSSSQQPPRGHTSMASSGSLKPSLGMLHPAANRHPKATHPWLLMGVQACRLPALKPSKRSKPSKPSKPLKSLKPLKRC